ncbi:hypothetical protein LAZ67_16001616 [Cordylochernes scorpioides]|uniref:Reverse transcriptase domain-containing protein n=1 Tax=Cordylochernes scorpioides TaxID=51811 RepID=A0ABY6LBQ5_9ARAC|nr:hypothetical protein LAZ67_16001616 [Cordylochernes scorpioides]
MKSVTPAKGLTIISKLRTSLHENMEKLLMVWMTEKQLQGDTLTQTIICEGKSDLQFGILDYAKSEFKDNDNKIYALLSNEREIDVSPYDGTFEAQSFFDNFDVQADRTELTYTDRLRKLPCYLQDFNNLQIYQNNDALPTNVYKFTKCKQDYVPLNRGKLICLPLSPRTSPVYTWRTLLQLYVHPPISPTHDIEISIPSNAAPQLEHCPHELHRILYEFSQVFSTNKYNVPKLNIPPVKINTTTDKIIALRPYRVPLHDQQEIQTQIEQMLQYGIIAPSVSPYASPITLVTKRDQTKRFCIDYRKLNEIIAPDVHPLPLIETILDKLSKAKYYSSVDIASAYWQVEIEPNSRNLLAFVTLDSQYEFCRLPYGFKNSPQIYHRAINQVMQKYKLNFVTHYFDDFIIFSDTLEDHLQHLQQFLTVCQHENIKPNYNKCSFFKTKIDFLGYTVTADLRTHLNPYPEINIAREIASSRTQNKHKKDKETFDKQHRTPHFEENDLVLVKNYRHPDTESCRLNRSVAILLRGFLLLDANGSVGLNLARRDLGSEG